LLRAGSLADTTTNGFFVLAAARPAKTTGDTMINAPRTLAHHSLRLTAALFAGFLVAGCGDLEPAEEGDVSVESGLTLPTPAGATKPYIYDGGTLCPDGSGAHCCPNGMAMTGAHLGRNVFKCATVGGGLADYYNDSPQTGVTQRNNMHACKAGWVMLGYGIVGPSCPWYFPACGAVKVEVLRCARPLPNTAQKAAGMTSGVSAEYVDPGSQDGFPMHVCREDRANPLKFVMSGIHAANNLFLCAQ
jgi:hypothetical protein